MNGGVDFWLGQLLSLFFYLMTIIVYNRAKKEYVGGKIAAAINLIMVCLAILLLSDFIDYFLLKLVPISPDIITILKILMKLIAICVLFFGGLRFFSSRPASSDIDTAADVLGELETDFPESEPSIDSDSSATILIEDLAAEKKPRLGRYEVLEQIGKGAMGIVYKGRDPKLNRLTAIKTIRFIDEFDEDKVERVKAQFYCEAEVVAKLSHKNIVMMYDVGEDLDLSYLAMEYLEGESLERHTSPDNLLPLERCLHYLIQVCEALDYAHRQGIVHRDIKPGNIMILKDGLIKVMDFGIARAAGSTKTRTGIIKGTPFYMSPEQARGGDITGSSDIFALGVLFYQLLTGRLPFKGENLATIMYQTANVAPEPVTTFQPDLDPSIVKILDKALEKDPQMRFASAQEMADALRDAVNALATPSVHSENRSKSIDMSGSESIDASDLRQVMKKDARQKGAGLLAAGESRTSAGDEDLSDIAKDTKKGFNLTELRQMMAAERQRISASDIPPPTDAGEELSDPGLAVEMQDDIERALISSDVKEPQPEPAASPPSMRYPIEDERRPLPAYAFPLAYAILALMLCAGCYYFFWMSPNADKRVVKLLYYKYFESPRMKEQKTREAQQRLVQEIMKQKMAEKQRLAQIEADKIEEQKKREALEEDQKKEQMALVMQKMEAEKKLEAERQAKLLAEQKRQAEALRRIEAQKKREAERLAREAEEKKQILEKQLQMERERREAERQRHMKRVENKIVAADRYRQEQAYTAAHEAYTQALEIIEESPDSENARLMKLKIEIQDKLLQDDMVYGPRGYIQHKGVWLTPAEYESTMYKEGYVKYKGALKDHRSLRKIIRAKTEPLVQAHVISRYADEVIHKKDIQYLSVSLQQNDSSKSVYAVEYRWEVWRFKGVDEGRCTIEITYEVSKDSWTLVKGCE